MLPTGPDPEIRVTSPPTPVGADPERFEVAIAAIDEANAADPNVLVVDGVARPKELAHAEAMTAWVLRLDPAADEAQLLAARAHHFRRWTYPRSSEPEGRSSYLRWRAEAKRRQAVAVAELLTSHGYDDQLIDRVRGLVAKEGLGRGGLAEVDGRTPAVQTHEDALCLVFLTTQFEPVADQLGDDKMVEVLARTLAKMGDRGRAEAFALPLDDRAASLVVEAMERLAGGVGPEPSAPPADAAGLDLLLATPVDSLGDGEGHDDLLTGDAPVLLVNLSTEDDSLDRPSSFAAEPVQAGEPEVQPEVLETLPILDVGVGNDGTDSSVGEEAVPAGAPDPLDGPTSGRDLPNRVDDTASDGPLPDSELDRSDGDHPPPDPPGEATLPRRASSVRRAMLWGERSHPPPVIAPPPPLPLDAPAGATIADTVPVAPPSNPLPEADGPAVGPEPVTVDEPEPSRSRRWFGRGSGAAKRNEGETSAVEPPPPGSESMTGDDSMPTSAPVELAVPAEPDAGAGHVDPWELEVAVARLSAGARRAAAVPLGIVSTMLVEGEVVEAVVQGDYQHYAAVVVLTPRRILIVNERRWAPDVRVVPIGADVSVQGWQDDRRATLVFGHRGRGLVVSGIVDRPVARDLAVRLRELVAQAGGPPA